MICSFFSEVIALVRLFLNTGDGVLPIASSFVCVCFFLMSLALQLHVYITKYFQGFCSLNCTQHSVTSGQLISPKTHEL